LFETFFFYTLLLKLNFACGSHMRIRILFLVGTCAELFSVVLNFFNLNTTQTKKVPINHEPFVFILH